MYREANPLFSKCPFSAHVGIFWCFFLIMVIFALKRPILTKIKKRAPFTPHHVQEVRYLRIKVSGFAHLHLMTRRDRSRVYKYRLGTRLGAIPSHFVYNADIALYAIHLEIPSLLSEYHPHLNIGGSIFERYAQYIDRK